MLQFPLACQPIVGKQRWGTVFEPSSHLRQHRRIGEVQRRFECCLLLEGLNVESLSGEEQIEVEEDYGICVKRGSDKGGKSKKRQRKMKK